MIRWPGHIPAGTVSHEIFSHLDWVPTLMAAAGEDNYKIKLLRDCPQDTATNRCHTFLDGYNQLPYLLDPVKKQGRRPGFIYFNDEGQMPGVRIGDWKIVYKEQRSHYYDVWWEPFVNLRLPKIFNLRRDPYERADTDSNNYRDWYSRHQYFLLPAQGLVQTYLKSFKDYPPSQAPFSTSLDPLIEEITNQINLGSGD